MLVYKAAVFFPTCCVDIDGTGNATFVTENGRLLPEELAVVATISELLTRLRNGKLVEYQLKADSFCDPNALLKCEWLKSGNLKIHGPDTAKRPYHLVDTKEAAVKEMRTFTCTRAVALLLPKSRDEIILTEVSSGKIESQS